MLQHNLTWSQELDKIIASLDGVSTADELAERIVAARRAIRQEIQDLVNVVDLRTDSLTGVSSRQELEEILGMLLAVKTRYERPFLAGDRDRRPLRTHPRRTAATPWSSRC